MTKMKAINLRNELEAPEFVSYGKPRVAAFKARVTRLAKTLDENSTDGGLLTYIASTLEMTLQFASDIPQIGKEILPPIFRIQLIRDSSQKEPRRMIMGQADAADVVKPYLEKQDRENLIVLLLDTKGQVIGMNVVSVGTINATLVHPREVFKPAILTNADRIILAHNHPSGDPTPSPEDVMITKNLMEAGQILGIDVLDHIIIGENGLSVSLKELGLM